MIPKSDTKECKALYPGSFNPFTTGHDNIVRRTLDICDHVVIGIGRNPAKQQDDVCKRAEEIAGMYAGEPRVSVAVYEGLSAHFARETGARFMVRGVRNASDFDYERTLAETNLRVFGIETIFLPAIPELSFVSSSMVRELKAFGQDVSGFIPKNDS